MPNFRLDFAEETGNTTDVASVSLISKRLMEVKLNLLHKIKNLVQNGDKIGLWFW